LGTVRSRRLAAATLAALGLVACGAPPPLPPPSGALRIAALAPTAAEILDRLGAAETVVAVGDFVVHPRALAKRPKVGAYDTPSAEQLLARRVNLVVTTRSAAAAAAHARLRALGIEVLELDTETYEQNLAAIERLGSLVGRPAAAANLVAEIRTRVAAVRSSAAPLPRRRGLVAVGREPRYAAGPGSYLDELVGAAGGENVLSDGRTPFLLASPETVLARRPEVIVDTSDNRPGAPRGISAGPWSVWPFVPAVAAGRVYLVDPLRLSIPGPRLAEMAELLARLIHPERFGAARPADFLPPAD